MNIIILAIGLLVLIQLVMPVIQKRILTAKRLALIKQIEENRQSRIITIIHREEKMNIFGLTVASYLDIEDSEQILHAIHLTPDDMPIDIILHTPGGLILPTEQIAFALKRHQGKVTVIIPHYAMSGGTMITLVADEIAIHHNAVMGSLDPILGSTRTGYFPAVSIQKALQYPNRNRDDYILILGDMAEKAIDQTYNRVYELLLKHNDTKRAASIALVLTQGKWLHETPIFFEELQELRLPITDQIPQEVFELMRLYQQPTQIKESVEFIPTPYPLPKPIKKG